MPLYQNNGEAAELYTQVRNAAMVLIMGSSGLQAL